MSLDTAIPLAALSAREWPTQATSYDFVGKIGHGAFATVWKAQVHGQQQDQNSTTVYCAVKILNLDHVDTNLAEIRLEVQAMRLSSHPNLLTCYTAFVHDVQLWLVTPLMSKGSSLHCLQAARQHLKKEHRQANMERHILYILHETLLGLQYIHENGQIHRDIKAGNILLDGNGDVKIADFGVSGWLVQGGAQQEKAKTFVGTPCWMAPEVMEQVHGYDYKADIWSLGITALELAKGYAPYAKYPPMKVLILTIQEDPPSLATYENEVEGDDALIDEEYSNTFNSLVSLCLQKSPSKRPACPELLQSRYFSVYNSDPTAREQARQSLQSICSLVRDVGTTNSNAPAYQQRLLPGNAPVSIVQSQEKDRPPGTTWVFADGSQVLSSTAAATAKPSTIDEVMAELDDFGKQTGGENYYTSVGHQNMDNQNYNNNQKTAAASNTQHAVRTMSSQDTNDDLDAFMDEFEQSTVGENFRR